MAQMNGLIELVFEDINNSSVNQFINELIDNMKIFNIEQSGIGNINQLNFNGDFLALISTGSEPVSVFVNTDKLIIESSIIYKTSIQLIRYNKINDVIVMFSYADVETSNLTLFPETLMRYSSRVAEKYGIQVFYCGYEPGSDKKTRLFTKNILGPLKLSS